MFDSYLRRWDLVPDGDPIVTPAARLLPVRHHGSAAILKIATKHDERFNAVLMTWWNGDGAAQVLAHDDDALLLERAEGTASLTEMARSGRDDEACRILCAVAEQLHRPRAKPLPALIPLVDWFRDLEPAAATHGGILSRCAQTAEALLAEPRDVGVLHGDLHHGNVLDFGSRGWLAIDPKRLIGERGFDFANIFTNPDIANAVPAVATDPNRFAHRLSIVAKAAELERSRLLQWILAWTGLSAAWFLNDGIDRFAAIDLIVAQLAAAELDR
ncbi:MAG: APH(6) family putative aminoglycoside O-phosphotransferase [Rhizobiales bacterium]|nr:APH(6) family putative aminoglycoside O-phosphotransferase [Hyphomicrobiales bacterium]